MVTKKSTKMDQKKGKGSHSHSATNDEI